VDNPLFDREFPCHKCMGTPELTGALACGVRAYAARLAEGDFDPWVTSNNSLHRFPPRFAARHRIPVVTSLHVPPFEGSFQTRVRRWWAPWLCLQPARSGNLAHGLKRRRSPSPARCPMHHRPHWPFRSRGAALRLDGVSRRPGPHLGFATVLSQLAGTSRSRLYGYHFENQTYFDKEIVPLLGANVQLRRSAARCRP